MAREEVKEELSKSHPVWHGTVGSPVLLEMLAKSWSWGTANISQASGAPFSLTGRLTVNLCSCVRFLKRPPLSSELKSQWWGGSVAMKLFRRKWQGRTMRGMQNSTRRAIWKGPKPLISSRISSNFIILERVGPGSTTQSRLQIKPNFKRRNCEKNMEINK